MYRLMTLILHQDRLNFFGFLQNNPTQVWQNGQFFKFVYFEPLTSWLSDFAYKGVYLTIDTMQEKGKGWQLVRDLPVAIAGQDLMTILEELEVNRLAEQRAGVGLDFSGWLFDIITAGLVTEEDTARLVKVMFLAGYDDSQVLRLFVAITRRKGLSRYFLKTLNRFYKGVSI